ncbi:MAG: hypothetical protein PQJ60_14630 [Spirochaetales bacterium]|nr:hypothetical protein [Spirochaetales bacterium]
MRLWIRTLFKDLMAVAVLLSLFYFAGREYLNLVSGKIRGSGDPIGVVSDLAYYPKRQIEGEEYTFNLSREDDLFEGDLVSSDSFSSILMDLVDGTEISLEHESSIILHLSEDTIYFRGTISALSTEKRDDPLMLINMDEENPEPIVLAHSSEITLSTDEKGVFNMSVLVGEATRGSDRIGENEQFTLSAAGETQVNRLNYILSTPANNSRWVTFEETLSLPFSWDEPDPAATRSLWVSQDSTFENILYHEENLTRLSRELELPPGDYFWRVGNEEQGDYSSTGKFKISRNIPLKALSPSEDTELFYREQSPKQTFVWQGAEGADYWTLELADSENMAEKIVSERTRYNQLQLSDLREGEYWWRVTARYEGVENLASVTTGEPEKLIVKRQTEALPPRLISPEEEEEITPAEFTRGVRFSWKGDPEIGLHRFILSTRRDMSEPIYTEESRNNYINLTEDIPPGAYYWQVVPLPEEDIPVQSSPVRSLLCLQRQRRLELIYPAAEEAVELEGGENLVFRWESSERGSYRFRLWLVTEEEEEKLVASTAVTRQEFSQYMARGGDYLWQVDLIGDNNRILLEGTPQPFALEQPLLPPQLITPLPGSSLSLVGEDKLPLSWTSVPNGDSYSGQLIQEGKEEPVLSFQNRESTLIEADISLLGEGSYTVELQTERLDRGRGFPRVSEKSLSSFTIDEIVIFEAPRITNPSSGMVTNRLDLLRDGLDIRWQSAYPFPSYEVVLKQKESGTLLMRRVTNRLNYQINDIYPDEYLIEVTGIDNRGGLSPAGQTSLTVLAVEPLSPVSLRTPQKGQTVDMSDLDSLEFRWAEAEAGARYNIALFDIRGEILFSLDNYPGTSYVFSDLSKLDVGEFIFAVEAVKEYNEIGIVRMSPETRVPFSITIKTIGEAPVILSPDVQYAD